ncbi:MAG: amidohydrolase family protein, partial [Bacteroidales bacterium]|nr:amidohydrolase family protein [Bacteroidales bacterium]
MILIGNGKVITRDSNMPLIEDGAVLIQGTKIVKVGKGSDLRAENPEAEYVDAKGGLIMPGLINTHNHIYSAMARGLSIDGYDPKGFLDILDGLWWTIDRHLTLEQTKQSAIATYIDCIKNGVTTVFDHHASFGSIEDSLFTISDAAKQLGVRTCLCYEVSDRDGEEKMRASVKENAEFIKHTASLTDDMQKAMMGMHAAFTISDETFALCREFTPENV